MPKRQNVAEQISIVNLPEISQDPQTTTTNTANSIQASHASTAQASHQQQQRMYMTLQGDLSRCIDQEFRSTANATDFEASLLPSQENQTANLAF